MKSQKNLQKEFFLGYSSKKLNIKNNTVFAEVDLDNIEELIKLREKIFINKASVITAIRKMIKKNPFGFAKEELEIIKSWQHYIPAPFIIIRNEKDHTIFLQNERLYAVNSISNDITTGLGSLPANVITVLLPYKDMIIHDGLIVGYNFETRDFMLAIAEEARELENQQGIITSLS